VQPRVIFFDFHDTLARYEPHHLVLYEQAATEHGVTLDRSAFDGTARQSWIDDAWEEWRTPLGIDHSAGSTDAASYHELRVAMTRRRIAAAAAGADDDAVESIARRVAELESEPRYFALFDDTLPALAALRDRGLRSFIVSNHVWELPEVASGLGLDGLVEQVLTSARVGYRKPHPAIYSEALRVAGVAASEALFVGDSWSHDVEGPRAAGMEAQLIDREGASGHADAVASLLELPLLDGAPPSQG
jgi:putative hydrolase of the HAD superfamily